MRWQHVQLSVRASFAAFISLVAADLLGLLFPIYAFIAAVIVTDLQAEVSRKLGLYRIGATIVGAAIGASLTPLLPAEPWGVGAGVLAAMLASQLLGLREGAKVAGYICGIILLDHGAEPWTYSVYRFLETLLGVLSAWAISYVPQIIPAGKPPKPS
jgi:uncharacterized membrane protein YgaE (UPF0421/DUF939 family)